MPFEDSTTPTDNTSEFEESVNVSLESLRQQEFVLAIMTTTVGHLLPNLYDGVIVANQGQLYTVFKDAEARIQLTPITDNQQLAPGTKVLVNYTDGAIGEGTDEDVSTEGLFPSEGGFESSEPCEGAFDGDEETQDEDPQALSEQEMRDIEESINKQ